MHYEVIKDREKLENFLNWLPDLSPDEKFYVSLFARKKYDDTISSTQKSNLRRFATDKKRLIDKLEQLELPFGKWKMKGEAVAQNSLAVYITPNPRCMRIAAFKTMEELLAKMQKLEPFSPQAQALTAIHRAKSRTVVVDFDIDLDNKSEIDSIMDKIESIVGKKAVDFVVTRGGMHVLVKPQLVVSEHKNWYPEIKNCCEIDQQGDLLMPIPGCTQGGFVPYIAQR